MKILFDLVATQPLHESKYHGGGEYSKAVFERAVHAGYRFDALFDSRKPLDKYIKTLCDIHSIQLIDVVSIVFPEVLDNYDRYFTGLPYGKLSYKQNVNCRIIFTIHGIRSLEMPIDKYDLLFYLENRAWKRLLKGLFIRLFPEIYRRVASSKLEALLRIKNCQVVTVSYHSKYSILNFFDFVDENNIEVCYSPLHSPVSIEESKAKAEEILKQLELSMGSFYLGLNSGRWIKNNLRLAKAFDNLISKGKLTGRKLVLTGGFKRFYNKLKNPENFIFLEYVDQETLEVLFYSAYGLLYPSLNEGFGYPPVQSMKYGTPVLTSAFSAVTEVCGDAVLYANPYSESEIGNRILMLENKTIHNKYEKLAIKRYDYIHSEEKRMSENLLKIIFE